MLKLADYDISKKIVAKKFNSIPVVSESNRIN